MKKKLEILGRDRNIYTGQRPVNFNIKYCKHFLVIKIKTKKFSIINNYICDRMTARQKDPYWP